MLWGFQNTGRSLAIIAALGATLAIVSGCASASRSTAMVAPLSGQTLLAPNSPLRENVKVGFVSGGEETNILLRSMVSNEDYSEAVITSMSLATLLAPNPATAAYTVNAELVSLEQPQVAVNLEVIAVGRYELLNPDGSVYWREEITSRFTAPFQDSFVRAERQRLANEGAIRENIGDFLERLIAFSRINPYDTISQESLAASAATPVVETAPVEETAEISAAGAEVEAAEPAAAEEPAAQ